MSALARFGDRLNPVLIKEVRASLRGRLFRVLFSTVAIVVVAVALILMADRATRVDEAQFGRQFFGAMYLCLCIAVLGFVPILAFLSMGGEWDEHTFELLEISNLRPRQIVLGKLWTAFIETMLYSSVFAPLLVFAFLLQGIDILNVLVVLSWAVLGSLSTSAIALALSSVSRIRAVRVLLLAVVAAGCIAAVTAMWNLAEDVAFNPWRGSRLDVDVVVGMYTVIVVLGCLAVLIATERLTHHEENHSTPARLFTTAAIVVCAVWLAILGRHGRLTEFDLLVLGVIQLCGLAIFHVFFVTERETLPRRVDADVASNRAWAIVSLAYLPGGGRALLHFLANAALVIGAAWLLLSVATPRTSTWTASFGGQVVLRLSLVACYFWILLAGLSFLAHLWTRGTGATSTRRWVARFLIPAVFAATMIVPSLVGFMFGQSYSPRLTAYAMNFIWVLDADNDEVTRVDRNVGVLVVAVLVLALNGVRIVRGVREVLAASSRSRARRGSAA